MVLLPFIIGVISVIGGLVAYFVYYQKVLKYPKPVRKVRKYRKTLKKKKNPSVSIINRERAFITKYMAIASSISSLEKIKSKEESISTDKVNLKNAKLS